MYKLLFPVAGAAALTLSMAIPAPTRASWLSEALHENLDQNQPAAYYDPVAPYYYTPVAPAIPVVPGYSYYPAPGYVPYAHYPHWHGYWDGGHHWHGHPEHFHR